jgi:hypothetical protein
VTVGAAFLLAHGIGSIRDLPVPLWLFYYGAAIVLVVSFVALGALWRKPLFDRPHYRALGPRWQRVLLGPELRFVLGAISVGVFVLVYSAAAVGENIVSANIAPTFIWVIFWLGLVPVVVIFGNVWSVISPWKAVADAIASVWRVVRLPWTTPFRYPERLGRLPAAALLFAFASLELAYPEASSPRTLAVAAAIYSWVTWLGMLAFGRRAWSENGEAFNVYFGFLGRIAPFAVENGKVVLRPPFSGLAGREEHPGTVAFVSVMLGSVAFDGFSRTTWWQNRVFSIETRYALTAPTTSDIAVTGLNILGLLTAVAAVALLYLLAVEAARIAGKERHSLAADFVLTLVPISLAYAVAHYFSLFVLQGQDVRRLVSDPFGRGWDLFGTSNDRPNLTLLQPNTIWYVQVSALVIGHVIGLALAHERAVTLFGSGSRALRTQYAMLVLMVAYTVGGLYLLSH